jgi:hypothetical protein
MGTERSIGIIAIELSLAEYNKLFNVQGVMLTLEKISKRSFSNKEKVLRLTYLPRN